MQPEPASLHWFGDPLANRVARAAFANEMDRLEIEVALTAELVETNPFGFVLDAEAATWPFAYPDSLRRELAPYLEPQPLQPWLAAMLTGFDLSRQNPVSLLVALNGRVHEQVRYQTRMEPGVQSPADTVERSSGSCRDTAWLLVLAARSLGLAARFVSGYLVQLVDAEHPVPGLERDGADLHAWAEMFLPGAGWFGLDATSGLITTSSHIALASGAHPNSAAPVEGTTTIAESHLDTSITVERIPPA